MADLSAEESAAAELNQEKKRSRTELSGHEHEEALAAEVTGHQQKEEEALAAEVTGHEHKEEVLAAEVIGHEPKDAAAPDGNKRPRTELADDETCRCQEEKKKMKTTRTRYPPEYVDFILSWNTDWKIPELAIDDEMTEEQRGMHLYAMEYLTELRARKKALQEFVKVQVEERGYAEMPEEAAEPPKYYDDDGEEIVYLGFGMYDE